MANADFYYGTQNRLTWIGSIENGGHVDEVPTCILIQQNKILYEELAVSYIKKRSGVVSSEGGLWPYIYLDSQLTDYVYIFETNFQQVLLFLSGTEVLFDPVRLLQGYSLTESTVIFEKPKFPLMNLVKLKRIKKEVSDGRKNTKYV